jgi:hypothetical protein
MITSEEYQRAVRHAAEQTGPVVADLYVVSVDAGSAQFRAVHADFIFSPWSTT